MKPERKKPHKACEPFDTIQRIRTILHECDLFTAEVHSDKSDGSTFFCQVRAGDEEVRRLTKHTGGKGMTRRYSLASCYGEYMERLQNGTLFSQEVLLFATERYLKNNPALRDKIHERHAMLEFQLFADEQTVEFETLDADLADILPNLLPHADPAPTLRPYAHGSELLCTPFYDVANRRVRLLPTWILQGRCGTNGMCAGNTPKEAILQGLSEIFERYAARMIFSKRLTPPDVPPAYFEGTQVLACLDQLKNAQGYDYVIKDCSLGMGLPVIGLVLVRKDGARAFHIGADPSPITSLERCLSELFQGWKQDLDKHFHLPRPQAPPSYQWSKELDQAMIDGKGEWVGSVFGTTPSYAFDGFSHPVTISDDDDLNDLMHLLGRLGRNLLVRDVSYLGFPAFQLYVPGMSELHFLDDPATFILWMSLKTQHEVLLKLPIATDEELRALSRIFENEAFAQLEKKVFPIVDHSGVLPDDVLFALHMYSGNPAAAARCCELFLRSEDSAGAPRLLYEAMAHAARLTQEGMVPQEVYERVKERFPDQVARIAMERVEYPRHVLNGKHLTVCFACENCAAAGLCDFFRLAAFIKPLYERQKTNMPNQAELAKLFT